MNANTIKAAVRKAFEGIDITEVKKGSFGVFTVKVKEERKRSTRIGLLMGDVDGCDISLDTKITWLN